jgi:hypothetical protein
MLAAFKEKHYKTMLQTQEQKKYENYSRQEY